MKIDSLFAGRFALTGVALATMLLASPSAEALGLGRLSVQSGLGETLRADIDITSITADEAGNLQVKVASPEAYRAAGVDYNPVLPGVRVQLQRRADGRPFLRVSSERAVQEPFVDVILELSWNTGRLVREYTLLFDPPSSRPTAAPSPAISPSFSPAETPRGESPRAETAAPAPAPRADSTRPEAASRPERRASAAAASASEGRRNGSGGSANNAAAVAPRGAASAPPPSRRASYGQATETAAADRPDTYKVRSGDSLSRIAGRTQRPGVSLDQMLVALYQANPSAFLGSNMNRLKSGVVLNVPSSEAANSVSTAEARQIIQAQSADFGAYRQRLAGAVASARAEAPSRQARGSVQADVDDRKRSSAPAPDKLTLSKGAVSASAPEAALSRQQERRDSAARMAELARNVEELKKLSGATSASARSGAAAASAPGGPGVNLPAAVAPLASAPASAARPSAASAATAAASSSAPASAALASAAASASAARAVPSDSAPSTAIASAQTASAAASSPATNPTASGAAASAPASPTSSAVGSTPTSAVAPTTETAPSGPASQPAPEPEPSSSILENPLALAAGGGLLALLLGFGIYRFAKRNKRDSGETSFLESRLQPDSFFGASGGQRIDTRDGGGTSSSMSYSLSQLDAIGDVDPVAEADVYLAYGRDLQAEEILKEAMRASPERLAIRTKLLEVYAKRRDTRGFEVLASQLYGLTGGEGEDWIRAQEIGRQIDADNPLYQAGGSPSMRLGDELHSSQGEPLGVTTRPQSILSDSTDFGSNFPSSTGFGGAASGSSVDLDLDLDLGQFDGGTLPGTAPASSFAPTATTPLAPYVPDTSPELAASVPAPAPFAAPAPFSSPDRRDEPSLDEGLSFDLPEPPAAPPAPAYPSAMEFDLSNISLDLGTPGEAAAPSPAYAPDLPEPEPQREAPRSDFADIDLSGGESDPTDPIVRKLELAEEFRQIGDMEGARDLLQEVVAKASGSVKARAQAMLDELG